MQIVMVTGASGFIGRTLCQELIQSGYEVHAYIRRDDAFLERLGVTCVLGNLRDVEQCQKVLKGIDTVVHCAGDPNFGNGAHYKQDNIETSACLIEAAEAQEQSPHLIFVSSIGAVDRDSNDLCEAALTEQSRPAPSSDYGKSKLTVEHALAASKLRHTIIRPSMVVGAGMRPDSHFSKFTSMALSGSPIARMDLPGRFSIIHVQDLARAIVHVMSLKDVSSNLYFCAGEAVSLGDFWRMVHPNKQLVPLGSVQSLCRKAARVLPFQVKSLFLDALVADDSPLQATGWTRQYSAKDALTEVIDAHMAIRDVKQDVPGTCMITGAASGLGKSLALKIGPHRKSLVLVDKDEDGLQALKRILPHASLHHIDLTNAQQIDSMMAKLGEESAPIIEIFACAGLGFRQDFRASAPEQNEAVFAVNVLARLRILLHALPEMSRRHFGRFVVISSSSAFQPLPFMSVYAATNAALLSAVEGISAEVGNSMVKLTVVCPGGMKTGFQHSAGVKVLGGEKLADPDDVADTILHELSKNKTTIVISVRAKIMAIMARILPRKFSLHLWKRLMGQMR